MSDAATQTAGPAATTTTADAPSLLDQVITATRPQDQREADRNRTYFKQFLESVVTPGQVVSKDVEQNIKYWIGEIDKKLSAQTNEILHHPDFQKLEGTWRGLHYLVHQSETGTELKLRVFNARKQELAKDLEKAVEFDQSNLFRRSTRTSTGCSAGRPTASWSGTTSSAGAGRTSPS